MIRAPVNTVDASWAGAGNGSQLEGSIKSSLSFIMNATNVSEPNWFANHWEAEWGAAALASPLSNDNATPAATAKVFAKHSGKSKAKVKRALTYEEKRRLRECRVDGCENYIINKGLCFRHGVSMLCFYLKWVCLRNDIEVLY